MLESTRTIVSTWRQNLFYWHKDMNLTSRTIFSQMKMTDSRKARGIPDQFNFKIYWLGPVVLNYGPTYVGTVWWSGHSCHEDVFNQSQQWVNIHGFTIRIELIELMNQASRPWNQMTLSQIDTLDTKFRENFGLVGNCIRGVIKQWHNNLNIWFILTLKPMHPNWTMPWSYLKLSNRTSLFLQFRRKF